MSASPGEEDLNMWDQVCFQPGGRAGTDRETAGYRVIDSYGSRRALTCPVSMVHRLMKTGQGEKDKPSTGPPTNGPCQIISSRTDSIRSGWIIGGQLNQNQKEIHPNLLRRELFVVPALPKRRNYLDL
jgi:uncharacterized NAD(P)/FAD-binding protein YdhS